MLWNISETERNYFHDKPIEYCAVIGVHTKDSSAPQKIYRPLYELYHRGELSSGVAMYLPHHSRIKFFKSERPIYHSFNFGEDFDGLAANFAIGHNRYATAGTNDRCNIQPFSGKIGDVPFALAHNGTIKNAPCLREELETAGEHFGTESDTEVIIKFIEQGRDIVDGLRIASQHLIGSYSLVILANEGIYAVRDPHGIKPLCIGRDKNNVYVASESAAFSGDPNIELDRELRRGEIFFSGHDGEANYSLGELQSAFDIFEYVYFARPDSVIEDISVGNYREELAKKLAKRDVMLRGKDFFRGGNWVIVPVQNSGIHYAEGFQQGIYEETGIFIPLKSALFRKRAINGERSFTQYSQEKREIVAASKVAAIGELVEGKRVILVDDSTVRGTTDERLVKMLKHMGAKEIHKRNGYAETKEGCPHGGIDMKKRDEHIANRIEDLNERAATIGFATMLYNTVGDLPPNGRKLDDFCTFCVSRINPLESEETRMYAKELIKAV